MKKVIQILWPSFIVAGIGWFRVDPAAGQITIAAAHPNTSSGRL